MTQTQMSQSQPMLGSTQDIQAEIYDLQLQLHKEQRIRAEKIKQLMLIESMTDMSATQSQSTLQMPSQAYNQDLEKDAQVRDPTSFTPQPTSSIKKSSIQVNSTNTNQARRKL